MRSQRVHCASARTGAATSRPQRGSSEAAAVALCTPRWDPERTSHSSSSSPGFVHRSSICRRGLRGSRIAFRQSRMMSLIRLWPIVLLVVPACVYDWTWPEPSVCTSNAQCGASQYCLFADHGCGMGENGSCQPRPISCTQGLGPSVCGCDRQVESSPCEAAERGVDYGHTDGCVKGEGLTACGYAYCVGPGEICRTDDSEGTQACAKYPAECNVLDCNCAGLCSQGDSPTDCGPDESNSVLLVACP